MRVIATGLALTGLLGLGACAVQPPQGPSFAAMPASGKSFEQFQAEDSRCRQTAWQSIGGGQAAAEAGERNSAGAAVAATALGAAAGALLGSASGQMGAGAAIGAGAGLLVGGSSAANSSAMSQGSLQRSYDITYAQCMAAAGNSVPPVQQAPVGYVPYSYAYPEPVYAYPPTIGFGFGWGGYHRRYW